MAQKTYSYSPKEPEEIDNLIVDSYNQLVQLERRNLLLVSSVVLFSALTKINPTTASFLGVTFDNLSEKHFYIGFIALILYFLTAYLIYGYPKFKSTLKAKAEISKKSMQISRNIRWFEIEWIRLILDLKYRFWLLFHYIFPVLFGIFAIVVASIKAF